MKRIGWVLDTSTRRLFPLPWDNLSIVAEIRYAGIACYLRQQGRFFMERYRSWKSYDAVVFVKLMNDLAFREANRLKQNGVRILFDANVNYYEIEGEFPIEYLRPTERQREQAVRMTKLADTVVSDSSYIRQVAACWNPRTVWIPDAVDTERYSPSVQSSPKRPFTMIWSGIASKAVHLEVLEPVLERLTFPWKLLLIPARPNALDRPAPVLERLKKNPHVMVRYWDENPYIQFLHQADVIVSPKILTCSYDLGHTEYKITLGMSAGLPAVASPQPSYKDAIGDDLGGAICNSTDEWISALTHLAVDPEWRQKQGKLAREKVLQNYSIPVVAERYANVLEQTCG